MPTVGGIPPTAQRAREYALGKAVGMVQKRVHDAEAAQRAERERKQALPKTNTERWKRWADENGVRPRGLDTLEVCRDARGRFAKLLTSQELTQHFGLMTAKQLPSRKGAPRR